jgi:hypothetical protein
VIELDNFERNHLRVQESDIRIVSPGLLEHISTHYSHVIERAYQ